jgi:predicted O-methyltransferase YrrM
VPLASEPVAGVLRGLRDYAEIEDSRAWERLQARESELGRRLTIPERYVVYGAAPPLAVSPESGELLYLLVRLRRPALVVEFGSSHGISTICLAAALQDAGGGSLLTTEILPEKAEATRRNLSAAGLDQLVEVRTGDALETLADVPGPIDVLFLDGRNDFYLPVLRLLEPALAPDALVIADLSPDDPALEPYLAHVREGASGYASLLVPLAAGVEVSLRA